MQVAIIGAAGLSGLELIRICSRHPQVELGAVTSGKYAGRTVGEAFPELSRVHLPFTAHDAPLDGCEAVFLAVPNQASLELVPGLLERGLRVVDLSGVFRLRDIPTFEKFYHLEHTAPDLLKGAVFGLPEARREAIGPANLVANPGCYATSALLGLLPLGGMAANLAAPPIIDAKSGVSGAGGRVEDETTNFMTVNENFKAYKVFSHQHTPEIEQVFADETPYDPAGQGALIFTPHLLPISRGIFTTIYLRFKKPVPRGLMWTNYADYAAQEPFVKLLPDGEMADLGMVRGSNDCVISLHPDETGANWVVVTVLDNLVKGAAGQAIQNLNIMQGWDETAGLV